jgi:menaquinone-dependent protoporphyrinogen oxidase
MNVLVTAASKHGATAEIAAWIGAALTEAGVPTDVRDPDSVWSLSGYDAVVIGSAVYAGKWLAPATGLVDRLGTELQARPVWLFSSGPAGDPPRPDSDPVDAAPMLAATNARGHHIFPGLIERKRLGLGERAIVSALRVPDGDFRTPDEVRTWARGIAADLGAVPVAG